MHKRMSGRIFVTCLSVLALILAAHGALAQSLSANAGLYSSFATDNGYVPQDEPVWQGDVTWKPGAGFSLNAWGSTGGKGEVDGKLGWDNDRFGLAIAYFDQAGGNELDVVQTTVKLKDKRDYGPHTLQSYLMFNTLSVLDAPEGSSGRFWRVGLEHEWRWDKRLSVSHGGYILYDSGVFRGDEGIVGHYEAGIGWVWHDIVLKPAARISVPLTVEDRDVHVVGVLKVSWPPAEPQH